MEKESSHEVSDGKDEKKAERPTTTVWDARKILLFISMAYGNFCLSSCYALPAPFYPQEAEKKGASPTVYGLVFGAFQLTNAIMSPIWGKLIPTIPPRFMVIAGMFVAGSCSILFGFLDKCPPGNSFIVLSFCVRIIESMGASAYLTGAYGSVPIAFPGSVGKCISVMNTFYGLGMIVGASSGGFLYQAGGYSLPFTSMGGLLLTGAVITFFVFPEIDEKLPGPSTSIAAILWNVAFLLDLLVYFSCFLAVGFIEATLEPHIRQFHLQPYAVGLIFVVNPLAFSILSPVSGYMIDKGMNVQIIVAVGYACGMVCFLLIGPVPFLYLKTYLVMVILSLALLGGGNGLQLVSSYMHGLQNIIERGFPDNVSTNALIFAMMNIVAGAGAFVGPSLGGILLEHTGFKMASLVMFAIQLLFMTVLLAFNMRSGCLRCSYNVHVPVDVQEIEMKDEECPKNCSL